MGIRCVVICMTKNKAGQGLPGLLLFSVLKVVQGGRIRTMVIAHSPAQRSSELTANCD